MFGRLTKIEGPRCPGCGCNDSEVLAAGLWMGMTRRKRRCAHCGRTWAETLAAEEVEGPKEEVAPQPAPAGIEYHRVHCPGCRSTRVRVSSTRRQRGGPTLRWHKCRDCGHTFKSTEA